MTAISIRKSTIRKSGIAAATLCSVLMLGACQDAGPNEQGGTAIGAGGGAVAGAVLGGWQGAVIGGLAGGVVGNLVGRDMDAKERERAEEASWRAARDGRRAEWRYEDRSRGYSEPASDYYRRDGRECRDFDQYMYKNGRDYRDRVTMCRNRDGSWSAV